MKIVATLTLSVLCVLPALAEKKCVHGTLEGQVLATGSGRILLFDASGKILWQHKGGNCSDIWKLENGNILHADNNVWEIDPKTDKVVWSYKPPEQKGGGTFSCQRLPDGNTLVGENSAGRLVEVDRDGKVVFELKLPDCKKGSHNNIRMVRKLKNGNYLVCYKQLAKVREFTPKGEIVFEVKVSGIAFSAVRLENGNTLVGHINCVTEFDQKSKEVWKFDKKELPDVKIGMICGIQALPNGNIVMGLYRADCSPKGAGVFEITRDKKLVWRYVRSTGKTDKNMMSVQRLDKDGKPLSNLR